jgi:hypothetical protein
MEAQARQAGTSDGLRFNGIAHVDDVRRDPRARCNVKVLKQNGSSRLGALARTRYFQKVKTLNPLGTQPDAGKKCRWP